MQADYTFHCSSIAYDLRNPRNTDEFDAWFTYEHEAPPLPPSDIFNELSPNKENTQIANLSKRRRQGSDENEKYKPITAGDLKSVGPASSAPKRIMSAIRDNSKVASNSTQARHVRHMSSPRPRPSSNRALSSNVNDPVAPNRQVLTAGRPLTVTAGSRSILISRSQSACKSRPTSASRVASVAIAAKCDDNSLEQIIRQHNQKIAPIADYIPRLHAGRDIKKWEKTTGRQWDDLKPEERNKVNEEIRRLKETNTLG